MYNKYQNTWRGSAPEPIKRGVGGFSSRRYRFRLPLKTLLICFIVFVVFIGFFSAFSIRDVRVVGAESIPIADIQETARAQESSRRWLVFPQSSVLFFNTAELTTTLHKKFPRVATVSVLRRFPPALEITISEHIPAAFWASQGHHYQLSQDGVVIGEVPNIPADAFSIINSAKVGAVIVGAPALSAEVMNVIADVAAGLKGFKQVDIQTIDIAQANEFIVRMITKGGWFILLSTHTPIVDQIEKLKIFIMEKERVTPDFLRTIHYLDLRFGSTRIYYQ